MSEAYPEGATQAVQRPHVVRNGATVHAVHKGGAYTTGRGEYRWINWYAECGCYGAAYQEPEEPEAGEPNCGNCLRVLAAGEF